MADRIGVINKGKLILVEEKTALMRKLGKKELTLILRSPMKELTPELAKAHVRLSADGTQLTYTFDARSDQTGIGHIVRHLVERGVDFKDLQTKESSLEDIFVGLVGGHA